MLVVLAFFGLILRSLGKKVWPFSWAQQRIRVRSSGEAPAYRRRPIDIGANSSEAILAGVRSSNCVCAPAKPSLTGAQQMKDKEIIRNPIRSHLFRKKIKKGQTERNRSCLPFLFP